MTATYTAREAKMHRKEMTRLEGFPADVNRRDSQGVKGARFLAH